jgi:hypothetical protein
VTPDGFIEMTKSSSIAERNNGYIRARAHGHTANNDFTSSNYTSSQLFYSEGGTEIDFYSADQEFEEISFDILAVEEGIESYHNAYFREAPATIEFLQPELSISDSSLAHFQGDIPSQFTSVSLYWNINGGESNNYFWEVAFPTGKISFIAPTLPSFLVEEFPGLDPLNFTLRVAEFTKINDLTEYDDYINLYFAQGLLKLESWALEIQTTTVEFWNWNNPG